MCLLGRVGWQPIIVTAEVLWQLPPRVCVFCRCEVLTIFWRPNSSINWEKELRARDGRKQELTRIGETAKREAVKHNGESREETRHLGDKITSLIEATRRKEEKQLEQMKGTKTIRIRNRRNDKCTLLLVFSTGSALIRNTQTREQGNAHK